MGLRLGLPEMRAQRAHGNRGAIQEIAPRNGTIHPEFAIAVIAHVNVLLGIALRR